MRKLTIFILFIMNGAMYQCQLPPTPWSPDTASMIKKLHENMPPAFETDMPPDLGDQALFTYTNDYKNMDFHYQNNQDLSSFAEPRPKGLTFDYNCLSQYTKCLMSLSSPQPVCAFNSADRDTGYRTAATYCDVYLENCRRGYRVWRILDTGICRFERGEGYSHVAKDHVKPSYVGSRRKYYNSNYNRRGN